MKKVIISLCYAVVMVASVESAFANSQESVELSLLKQTYSDDKYYNWVCWLTSHNSYAYRNGNTTLIKKTIYINPNQLLDIKGQLDFGVRGFAIDLYYKDNDKSKSIILAHSTNEQGIRFYEQDFSSPFLENVKKWLVDHPEDIITLHLESYIRNYDKIITELKDAGLYDCLFDLCEYNGAVAKNGEPKCISSNEEELKSGELQWPTLGKMRRENKRLVIFSDKTEDVGYGIMHVSNTMETEYDIAKFSACEKRLDGREKMASVYVMNHFYGFYPIPGATTGIGIIKTLNFVVDKSTDLSFTSPNQYRYLVQRAGTCFFQDSKWPNFIVVDNIASKEGGERQIALDINKNNQRCDYTAQNSDYKSAPKYKDNEFPTHDEL